MSDLDDDLRKYDSPVWPDGRPDTRRKYGDVLRETVKRRLRNLHNDAERTIEYLRMMMADRHDITDELKEMERLGWDLQLVALILKREVSRGR